MPLDRRITNGLAWAGLVLVVAVPTADLLSAQFMPGETPTVGAVAPAATTEQAAVTAPVAVVKPVAPTPHARPVAPQVAATNTTTNGAVDSFLQTGKPLPSYITDGNAQTASVAAPSKPAAPQTPVQPTAPQSTVASVPATRPTVTAPATGAKSPAVAVTKPAAPASDATIDPVEVASLPTTVEAPTPMPLSMRPRPVLAASAPQVPNRSAPGDEILLPPEVVGGGYDRPVSEEDLADWESGPLADFLAQREQGRAPVAEDEYWMDEAPVQQRPRRDRVVGPAVDDFFYPFVQ